MKEMTGSPWPHDPSANISSLPQPQIPSPHLPSNQSGRNVFRLLARREVSPRTRYIPNRRWCEAPKLNADSSCGLRKEAERDARHALFSWVEAESLRHLSAKYCPLIPPPRSTIAAAFSPDGRTLASTHGDHTVKIIDCQSGSCLRVLSGHRRTPWVVRFHPMCPEILASGSLDHEVRLWDANTSDCIGSRDFYRPIASLAFHAKGEVLAVASGHKLYMWHYNKRGEGSSPTMVLKTRRSLRAVHFHPHGAPLLLTAEVNDLDSSDSSMTLATSQGYLHYPPPAVFMANVHSIEYPTLAAEVPLKSSPSSLFSPCLRGDSRLRLLHDHRPVASSGGQVESPQFQFQPHTSPMEQIEDTACPMDTSPELPSSTDHNAEPSISNYFQSGLHHAVGEHTLDVMEGTEMQPVDGNLLGASCDLDTQQVPRNELPGEPGLISDRTDIVESLQSNNLLLCRDPAYWELPFVQGWLMGQTQTGMPTMLPLSGSTPENLSRCFGLQLATWAPDVSASQTQALAASVVSGGIKISAVPVFGQSGLQNRFSHYNVVSATHSREETGLVSAALDGSATQSIISRVQAELASLLAVASAELPCTVKLRIWPHDVKNPCALLNADKCRITIPHAVLCSEMGAHFSPCGRFLAACVACVLPNTETDGSQTQIHYDARGAATSPTRHPATSHQVIYELRIYSLEEATFGSVLASRAIRAAHCLTSIQFSPTSEHILLAYGRRHSSLLKSIVINGETTIPIYTILEVYRVSDMELVKVLPSAEDEVNVACFHPLPGGGLVYGTKEGKLRVLQFDGSQDRNLMGSNFFLQDSMVDVDQYPSYRHVI